MKNKSIQGQQNTKSINVIEHSWMANFKHTLFILLFSNTLFKIILLETFYNNTITKISRVLKIINGLVLLNTSVSLRIRTNKFKAHESAFKELPQVVKA